MAVGDRNEKRLIGPVALSNVSTSTIGSAVPASRVWVGKQIVICNTDGIERLVYLALGSNASNANARIVSGMPIAISDTVVLDTAVVMTAGEYLYGYADSNNVVTVTMFGWEKEV